MSWLRLIINMTLMHRQWKYDQTGGPAKRLTALLTWHQSHLVASKSMWFALGYHRSDHYPFVLVYQSTREKRLREKMNTFQHGEDTISKIDQVKQLEGADRRQRRLTQPPLVEIVEKSWADKRQAVKLWLKAKKGGKWHQDDLKALKIEVDEKTTHFKLCTYQAQIAKWDDFCQTVCSEKLLKMFWCLH